MTPSKSILITGASCGIGCATARYFHEKGWQVAATMRNPADAPDWMAGQNVVVLPADVTDQASLDQAVDQALAAFGKIDVVFANAGYGLNGPVEGVTEDQMHRQFDVNVFGIIRTIKAVAPHMRQRKEGVILATSSIGGRIGMPVAPLYISSKHAVEGLIESARFELAPLGVRLKLILPGGINTQFSRRSADWTDHPDYSDAIRAGRKLSVDILDGMPDARDVAIVVYKAATDSSKRLRYLAKPGPYMTLYKLLPDSWWRGMIAMALRNSAKSGERKSTKMASNEHS